MQRLTRRAFLASLGVSASLGSPMRLFGSRGDLVSAGWDHPREPIPQVTPLSPPFRLPESWYRQTVKRLQERLAQRGLDGIILKDRWNIIYVSGLFHTTTERPFWLFVPTRGEPVFFYPGLDKDLVNTWWIKEGEWYFDYPHAGPFNTLAYKAGPRADLLQWMLKGTGQARLRARASGHRGRGGADDDEAHAGGLARSAIRSGRRSLTPHADDQDA
ncbi:MAG: aminopeptidase P family N-terminal domain-containing protein [Acidobacteriota bacterium]|nr:aminopeptidase P family N-terminal domain-containing protein [Acidobacteriota bacterium]